MTTMEPPKASPTDAQAWNALMPHEAELEQFTVPGSLRTAMLDILKIFWNINDLDVDLGNFALLFKDKHYRELSRRWCTGPAAELFSGQTFRKLKASRLEGQWDYVLESFLDWVEHFAGTAKSRIRYVDCERILGCVLESQEFNAVYQLNIAQLFGRVPTSDKLDPRRPADFLSDLADQDFDRVYQNLLKQMPETKWNIRDTLWDIQNRSGICKTVMLHVCFWYAPDLKEPAHRADNKAPLRHHLRRVISNDYVHTASSMQEDDEILALHIQRTVVKFVLQNYNLLKSPEVFLRGRFVGDALVPYGARFTKEGWSRLVALLRNNFDLPFKYTDLVQFNDCGPLSHHDVQNGCKLLAQEQQGLQTKEPPPRASLHSTPSKSPFSDTISKPGDDLEEGFRVEDQASLNDRRASDQGAKSKQRRASTASESEHSVTVLQSRSDEPDSLSRWKTKREVSPGSIANGRAYGAYLGPRDNISSSTTTTQPQSLTSNGRFNLTDQQSAHPSPSVPNPLLIERPSKRARPDSYTQPTLQQHSPAISYDSPDENPGRTPPGSQRPRVSSAQSSARASVEVLRPSPDNPPPLKCPSQLTQGSSTPTPSNQPQPLMVPSQHPNPILSHAQPYPQTTDASPAVATRRFRILPPPSSQVSHPSASQTPALAQTKIEQAVQLLQDAYGEVFAMEDLLIGIECLKDEVDAGIFLTLKPGPLRDRWMRSLISKK